MERSPQELYQARIKRVSDAVSLKTPDRVPIASLASYFLIRYAGLTNKDGYYNFERAASAIRESAIRLNWDMLSLSEATFRSGPVLEKIGFVQQKWPGYNLPDNVSHQFVEAEYMLADEYDEFLRDPGDFTTRKLLPRVAKVMAPFATLPPLYLWYPSFFVLLPSLAGALQTMLEAAAEVAKFNAIRDRLRHDLEESGYPLLYGGVMLAPFDHISDYYRGMRGSMLDMYRCPDKLLAAMDLVADGLVAIAMAQAKLTGNPRVFVPVHRGAGGFMSKDQFAKFYWPGLKKQLLALIDAGLTPIPFWEGDYTPRLEFLAELPPGKVLGHFDVVDLKRCKEILGDTMCFMGNVPAQLLVTGKPAQVKDYVRTLIDTFGDNGGLIVDGAVSGVADEARPENVEAMTEAVHEYGVYR